MRWSGRDLVGRTAGVRTRGKAIGAGGGAGGGSWEGPRGLQVRGAGPGGTVGLPVVGGCEVRPKRPESGA